MLNLLINGSPLCEKAENCRALPSIAPDKGGSSSSGKENIETAVKSVASREIARRLAVILVPSASAAVPPLEAEIMVTLIFSEVAAPGIPDGLIEVKA